MRKPAPNRVTQTAPVSQEVRTELECRPKLSDHVDPGGPFMPPAPKFRSVDLMALLLTCVTDPGLHLENYNY